jgi:5-methylcytosine-specific restriction endonuclease McrA
LLRQEVIDKQGRICQECGRRIDTEFDLTVDHIKPRSKFPDQALDESNLRVLCRSCNSKKDAAVITPCDDK